MNLSTTYFPKDFRDKKIEKNKWELISNLDCTIILDNATALSYSIRKGFKTNYRSGPKWLDELIPKIGTKDVAISWIIHDINYEGYLSQKRADSILYYMLLEADIKPTTCEVVYWGLRFFGSFNYSSAIKNEYIQFGIDSLSINESGGKEDSFRSFKSRKTTDKSILPEELIFDKANQEEVKRNLIRLAKENGLKLDLNEMDEHYR